MREYSKISPKFWMGNTGKQIRALGLEAQVVAFYLLTCPHATMLGIYYLPIAYIANDISLDRERVWDTINKLIAINFCSYENDYIWVHEMARHQIAERLDSKDKRIKSIQNAFQVLPDVTFLENFYQKYQDRFHLEPRNGSKNISTSENKAVEQVLEPMATPVIQIAESTISPIGGDTFCATLNPALICVTEKSEEGGSLLENSHFALETSPFEGPSMPLRSQYQEQYQEQKQYQEQYQEQQPKKTERERKVLSGKPDVALPVKNFGNHFPRSSPSQPPPWQREAIEVLHFLNEKTGRIYRPVPSNLRLIIARLRSGVTVAQCRQVIAKKTREWRGNPRMAEYLRPATLFDATKFEQYLGELVCVQPQEQPR